MHRHIRTCSTIKHNQATLPRTKEESVAWAQENGLLPKRKICRYHRLPMKLFQAAGKNQARFRCTRRRRHEVQCPDVPLTKGTWFEDVRLKLNWVIKLMYAFVRDWPYEEIIHELMDCSLPLDQQEKKSLAVSARLAYCREMMTDSFYRLQVVSGPLGGPGTLVRIGESKFGKRKCSRGRLTEGHWVVGMIQDRTDEVRMIVVEHRDAETLLPLIQQHVRPGTTIHTNMWAGYRGLANLGFIHRTVNRSDCNHPFLNWFRGHQVSSAAFGDHLVEYLWRRHVRKHELDAMETLIQAVRSEYGDLRY